MTRGPSLRIRLAAMARAAVVCLPLVAAAGAAQAARAQSAPSALLPATALGASYEPLNPGLAKLSCTAVTAGLTGATCSQALWRLRPAVVKSTLRGEALLAYELVVTTQSAQDAQGLSTAANANGARPWRLRPYRSLKVATWRLGFKVAPRRLGPHDYDWWWLDRGNDFVLLVFEIVPNATTNAFDQAMRDQAATAVDEEQFGISLPSVVRLGGSLLLDQSDFGAAYSAVPESAPIADCAVVTGASAGYTCTEGVWEMQGAAVAAQSSQSAVAAYELVVQTPSASDAQALDNAIATSGNGEPWNMAQYKPVDTAMWNLAGQVQPGIANISAATGDWWQRVRGSDFILLDFVIDGTAAAQNYDETMTDQADAIVSEQILASLTAAASG